MGVRIAKSGFFITFFVENDSQGLFLRKIGILGVVGTGFASRAGARSFFIRGKTTLTAPERKKDEKKPRFSGSRGCRGAWFWYNVRSRVECDSIFDLSNGASLPYESLPETIRLG